MRHFSGDLAGMRLLMADELERIAGGYGEDEDTSAPPTPAAAPDEFTSCYANFNSGTSTWSDWQLCTPSNPFGGGYDSNTGIITFTSPNAIMAYNTATGEYHNYAPGGTGAIVTINTNTGVISGSGGA